MKIDKIKFKIQDFSGSDPDHPPQELLIHTPFATGWQSERQVKGTSRLIDCDLKHQDHLLLLLLSSSDLFSNLPML